MTRLCQSVFFFIAIACLLLSNAAALVTPNQASAAQRSSSSTSTVMSQPRLSFVGGATTLVPEAPVAPSKIDPKKKQRKESREKTEDLWEVRLYNDKYNTHEWVARCLVVVAGTSEWQAYLTTKQAHTEGEAFLGLYEKEIAELYTEGLREQGIIVRMFPVGDFQ